MFRNPNHFYLGYPGYGQVDPVYEALNSHLKDVSNSKDLRKKVEEAVTNTFTVETITKVLIEQVLPKFITEESFRYPDQNQELRKVIKVAIQKAVDTNVEEINKIVETAVLTKLQEQEYINRLVRDQINYQLCDAVKHIVAEATRKTLVKVGKEQKKTAAKKKTSRK